MPSTGGDVTGREPERRADGSMAYPRVLIVSRVRVTERDSSGAALGKWFAEWPRSSLAQVFSGGPRDLPGLAGSEYQFGPRDRRGGRLFGALKMSPLGMAARPKTTSRAAEPHGRLFQALRRLGHRASEALVETGVWELAFAPRLSDEFVHWVRRFAPDVVFAIPSDYTFTRLALELQGTLGLPVAIYMPDDFPWRGWAFRALVWRRLQVAFSKLATGARARFGTGPVMATEYLQRYGLRFEPLMSCDEAARFRDALPERVAPEDSVSIVYAGGLGHGRWRSLRDADAAAERLSHEGMRVRIEAFTPYLSPSVQLELSTCRHLALHDAVSDARVPAILRGADILLLAEGFDRRSLQEVRLSIASKSHLYMMSQRATLVYGPAGAGVVEYARQSGWGLVVDVPSIAELAAAIRRLMVDRALRERLVERGRTTAEENHEAGRVRAHLRGVLAAVAWSRAGHSVPGPETSAPGRAPRA